MSVVVSKPNQALLVPDSDAICNLYPDAKTLRRAEQDWRVVPHNLESHVLLGRLGLKQPNPMLLYYNWHGGVPFAVQRATCALLTTNMRAYCLNDMGCVDADTEYLGEDGWHRIADYRLGKVAQYWPGTNTIDFVQPNKYVKLPCQEMIRFKTTRDVDQLLSPEHRVLLADGSVLSADEVEATYQRRKNHHRYKFRTTFRVDSRPGIRLTDAEIRVQIAVNADGHMCTDTMVAVNIKKSRKVSRMQRLLVAANISYVIHTGAPGYSRFYFAAPWPKGFSYIWWQANQKQLEIIADEAVHWDGSRRKAAGQSFSSFSKVDADFIQYACSAAGWRSSLVARPNKGKTEYVVHSSRRTTAGLYGVNGTQPKHNVWREPTKDGYKYCFMVPSMFLLLRRNGCIFATGNTGKTKAALWAWDYLNRTHYCGKLLVCATLSTLDIVWAKEIFSTLRGRRVAILHGDRATRLKRLADPDVDIYVINHDGFKTIFDDIMARDDIDALVIDELASYRNSNGRSKAMVKLAARMTWVWGLTGAPMPNEPVDVWMQARIITPHTVPKYQKQAREMLMRRLSQYKWLPKPDAVDNAFKMLQPSVRFTLDDITELPQRIERTIDIPLIGTHKNTYLQVSRHMQAMIQGKKITAGNAGVAMSKLLQIAGGWVYGGNREVISLTPHGNTRIDILLEIIQESAHKVIVFVPFRHMIEGLSAWMTAAEIDHAVIHGDVKHRDRIFNAFQNSERYKVILAHPKCMAHGLTLTAANVVVWYCPITSLEIYDQANARIRRYGQTQKQIILHLSGTPVESKIYAMLRRKQRIQDQLLAMLEGATADAQKESNGVPS